VAEEQVGTGRWAPAAEPQQRTLPREPGSRRPVAEPTRAPLHGHQVRGHCPDHPPERGPVQPRGPDAVGEDPNLGLRVRAHGWVAHARIIPAPASTAAAGRTQPVRGPLGLGAQPGRTAPAYAGVSTFATRTPVRGLAALIILPPPMYSPMWLTGE